MKRKIVYTDAPPEIEEAIANGKIIPNFINIDSLVRRDGTQPIVAQKMQTKHRNAFKKVAVVL